MKFQRKKVATALSLALGLSGTTLLGNAYAADVRVDVTGTNIPRVEAEGALPVTVITREDIERTGATSAQELLQYITANTSVNSFNSTTVIGATTFGLQSASLRGLGGARTLVLLNGRRPAGFSGDQLNGQSVNLLGVPFSAIERVEVLRDSASAIYGTDAIGGVINFILRKDYQGAEGTVYYGAPTRSGGGEVTDVQATAGWGDLTKNRFNFLLSADWHKEHSLYARDRNFANTSIIPSVGLFGFSSNSFPATVTAPPGNPSIGTINPTFPNCAPSVPGPVDLFGPGNKRCVYDPQVVAQILPEVETKSLFGSARMQLTPSWQAYLTGSYTTSDNHNIIQPVPLSDIFNDPIILQSTSPFYPLAFLQQNFPSYVGRPLNIRYRSVLTGDRDITDTNEQSQGILGLQGNAWNWNVDAGLFYGHTKTKEVLNGGFPRLSQVVPLLNSGLVNFFGDTPADIAAQVNATNFRGTAFSGTTTLYGGDAKASRDLFQLPAGPLAMALGGEARKEKITNDPNPALETGDISGYGGEFAAIERERTVWAVFGEVNVPIFKSLEADAAVRYDHYSDFGNTTNPKFSLRYQPMRQLLVRSSYSTGFLAPSLQQLHLPVRNGVTAAGTSDPLRCPITADARDCLTQFNVNFGGNTSLKPEESEAFTVGFVFEPIREVSFGVDYFHINVANLIQAGLPVETILGDLPQFGGLVARGPVDPGFPNLPGPITAIDQRNLNIGKLKVEGFDVDLRIKPAPTALGRLLFTLQGTYFKKNDTQNLDKSYSGFVSNQSGSTFTGIVPRWKHYATVNLERGPWSFTLANTYQASYIDFQTDLDDNARRVGSMSLFDVQASYTGFRNVKLTAGVKNIADRNPPVTNQQVTFQSGFDPSYYDARARFVYGSVTVSWKP